MVTQTPPRRQAAASAPSTAPERDDHQPPPPPRDSTHRGGDGPSLTPSGGPVLVVRWLRPDGHQAESRYYRRGHDARAFASRLRERGREPRIFTTRADWTEVDAR